MVAENRNPAFVKPGGAPPGNRSCWVGGYGFHKDD